MRMEAGWAVLLSCLTDEDSDRSDWVMEMTVGPPDSCRWSGPWEPFGVMGQKIAWRRPYVPIVTEDDTRLAGDTTFAERR